MKTLIYISGILGALLLVFRIIGMYTHFMLNDWLLYAGIALIGFIYIPLSIYLNIKNRQKIQQIIASYKDKNPDSLNKSDEKSKTKSWGMNNSPYRERKSGLRWGGGNIKAASASRGKRKPFLR